MSDPNTIFTTHHDLPYKNVIPSVFSVRTCGKPHIQNIMSNVTAKPGQMASFKCQVDMSCIVAYIEWYHEMDNGTEKLIKVRRKDPLLHIKNIPTTTYIGPPTTVLQKYRLINGFS